MRVADDPIAQLLAGTYPDPDTGELLAAQSRAVVIEDSLDGREADLVASLDVGTTVAIVSDVDTHAALGHRIERALASRFVVQSIVLESRPHADAATVARLGQALAPGTELVIAVGSGTLNDLAKMVAYARDVPQVVFATAPSMNGYTSVSASITVDGMKRSFRVRTPLAVFVDLRVLAAAPTRLIRAGLGDSACRSTAQADWLLSHLLLGTPYRTAPFALLAADEPHLLANPAALVAGELPMMRHLVRTLVLSGFGMTLCQGSYPASQGEHLLSHYMDMTEPSTAFHGEQIGVCTIAMATLQERVLARSEPPVLRGDPLDLDTLVGRYGELIGNACWLEIATKRVDTAALAERLAREWDTIRARIRASTVPAAQLRATLEAAGVPVEPEQIGWRRESFATALRHAHEIRGRYTFLDLVAASARDERP